MSTCGPVPAGEIRHLDHDSPHGHERHECGSRAGLDWTKKEHEMTTVYISIGNSDDKLTQAAWAQFYRRTNLTIRDEAIAVHGQWVSEPASAWQNACWCVELLPAQLLNLKPLLREIAGEYGQDSIAWAEAPTTEFLAADRG